MGKQKSPVTVDQTKCKPCEGLICVGVCPVGVLEPDSNGKPDVSDVSACTVCGVCADLCPTKAIAVKKEQFQASR